MNVIEQIGAEQAPPEDFLSESSCHEEDFAFLHSEDFVECLADAGPQQIDDSKSASSMAMRL